MMTPTDAALAAFERTFGGAPTCVVQAPGRVNLIGEHTDYNDGFVLPCAIDRGTVIAARLRDDDEVHVVAADLGHARDRFVADDSLLPRTDAAWANYVRGPVRHLIARSLPLRGAELAIAGNVPQGAGLSSSASLEVAVIQAFKQLQGLDGLPPARMARIAQESENRFVGCACGVMDMLASACGVDGHALLIDCRSLALRPIPLPPGLAVMVVDSRVTRGLVDSEYNLRRQQCEAAARHFGVAALRDLAPDADLSALDDVVRRRARHVITENRRTLDAADALAAGDLRRLGELMAQSHRSMRDDFEITVPPIDTLVELLQAAIGPDGGARMTGGGFGGCVVALLPQARLAAAQEAVARYRAPGGQPAAVFVCRASTGAGALP